MKTGNIFAFSRIGQQKIADFLVKFDPYMHFVSRYSAACLNSKESPSKERTEEASFKWESKLVALV